MSSTPQAKSGLQHTRSAYWTGFQIVASGANRASGDIVGTDLKVGHIVQLDPVDKDGVGVGMAVSRPTAGYNTKLFVVTAISQDTNEIITDLGLGVTRRRGGKITVSPVDCNIDAWVAGATTQGQTLLGLNYNSGGADQYMTLTACVPTTVAHLLARMSTSANTSRPIGVAMATQASGTNLIKVQLGDVLGSDAEH